MTTLSDTTQLAQRIEDKLDKSIAGGIRISTQGGMLVEDAGQAMEVAKLMAISGAAVPAHVRNNPGICFAITVQAWEWSMNPFAVANKSYVVNDRLAYESALYNAVATRRAPIVGRLKVAYDGQGETRRCTISAKLRDDEGGGDVEYTSPMFKQINPKNSPLWKNDPDQQLFYFATRAFVRRHFPDVMMGVYTVDEVRDAPPDNDIIDTTATPTSKTAALADKLAGRNGNGHADTPPPAEADKTDGEPQPGPADPDGEDGHPIPDPASAEEPAGDAPETPGSDAKATDAGEGKGDAATIRTTAVDAFVAKHDGASINDALDAINAFTAKLFRKELHEITDIKTLQDIASKVEQGVIKPKK